MPPQSNGVNFAAPNILIGTTRSIESTGTAVRALLKADANTREITSSTTCSRAPASELGRPRRRLMGFLAILLAVIGIHGVLAYSVSRRTREIGVRVAVGANPAMVARSVVREAVTLTVIGIAIGLPAAYFASRALRSLMFGISENDALTFAAAAACFLLDSRRHAAQQLSIRLSRCGPNDLDVAAVAATIGNVHHRGLWDPSR